jgi:hypothetical protein
MDGGKVKTESPNISGAAVTGSPRFYFLTLSNSPSIFRLRRLPKPMPYGQPPERHSSPEGGKYTEI